MGTNIYAGEPSAEGLENLEEEVKEESPKQDEVSTKGNDTTGDE